MASIISMRGNAHKYQHPMYISEAPALDAWIPVGRFMSRQAQCRPLTVSLAEAMAHLRRRKVT